MNIRSINTFISNTVVGNKLVKETVWSILSKGSAFVLFYATNIFLARFLGPVQFGSWSLLFSCLTIIYLLADLGLSHSSRKFLAEYSDTDEVKPILATAFFLRFLVSTLFAVTFLLFCEPLASAIGRPAFSELFRIAIPFLFLIGILELIKQSVQGLHRLKFNFLINTVEYSLRLVFVVVLLSASQSIAAIITSYTAATFLTVIFGLYILYANYYADKGVAKVVLRPMRTYAKRIWRYSAPLFVVAVGWLVATEIDIIMLGLLRDDYEVGIYSAAKQIIAKLPHVSLAIALGTMPIFARLTVENRDKLQKILSKLVRINTVIFGPIALGLVIFSEPLIRLVYGGEFDNAALPLQLLVPYVLVHSYAVYYSFVLDYQGLASKRALYLILSVLCNIALNYLLIPRYGAAGAAVATSITHLPYVFLNWFEVRKVLGRDVRPSAVS